MNKKTGYSCSTPSNASSAAFYNTHSITKKDKKTPTIYVHMLLDAPQTKHYIFIFLQIFNENKLGCLSG